MVSEVTSTINVLAPISVYYQPVVDLVTERTIGCEALSRWPVSNGDVRTPGSFIASIEHDFDLAVDLTSQVFHSVSRDLGAFLATEPDFYVSINVPPVLLVESRLDEILEESRLVSLVSHLIFEVTERQALDERGRTAIARGRELGVRVALDDFGTGQSGFRDLMGLKVDFIKLDQSFVGPLNRDPQTERLVRAFAAFAAVLGVGLVAEGIETREQAAFLRAVGVEKAQGFLWSKAVPAADLLQRYARENDTKAEPEDEATTD